MGALAFGSSAVARDWPDAGGFEIHEGEQFCYLYSLYKGPGESALSLAVNRQGAVMVMVLNDDWSAKPDVEYKDLEFLLDGISYDGGVATGIENGGKHGFMQPMNKDFLPHFVQSSYLNVYKSGQIVDRLSLVGSGAAVAAVKRCVVYVDAVRSAEEREKKRYEDLPKDPFSAK